MSDRRAAMTVERHALRLVARLAEHGVVEVPGLPIEVRRLVGEVRRSQTLTDSGLALLHHWRHLLFADGAEQAAIDWLWRDRAQTTRLESWAEAHPYLAVPSADLVQAGLALDAEAARLVDSAPEVFALDGEADDETGLP